MWDWVGEFRAWPENHFGWRALIAQHNDHRIATARVMFLIDALLFRMRGRFIVIANMTLLVLLGLFLHRLWRGRAVAGTAADLPAIFFVAAMTSICQWENLVTPFQIQFALLLACAALAVTLTVAGTSRPLPVWRAHALILAAAFAYVLAAYSMAGGILLLPVLLGLLAVRRARLTLVLLFAIPCCAAVLLFFQHYIAYSFLVPMRGTGQFVLLLGTMSCVGLEFLGSAFGGVSGTFAIAAGLAGLALFGTTLWRAWRAGRPLAGAEAILLGLAAFVVANGVAAARTRGYFSFWGGLASRYSALSVLFFISTAGAYCQIAGVRAGSLLARSPLAPVLAILALAAFNLPPVFEQQASTLMRALQTAGTTLRQGVYAPTRIGILNPFSLDHVIGNVRFAQRHRLTIFADTGRPPEAVRAVLDRADPARLQTCLGAVDTLYRLDASRAVIRVWLATPDPTQTVEWVQVRDASGHAAVTLPGQELRDDTLLGPHHARIMGVSVGFSGAIGDGPLTLIGAPATGAPCSLMVPGPGPVRIQELPDQRPVSSSLLDPVQAAPSWSRAVPGMPPDLPPLWPDTTGRGVSIWTSAAQGDAATGDLSLRVQAPGAGLGLATAFATGPSPDGQSLIFTAADGTRVAFPVPADTQANRWRIAAVPADFLARHPGPITVTARDQGTGFGQWLAVAAPFAARLDPDAARLDGGRPPG
jgi:hypothetical protein